MRKLFWWNLNDQEKARRSFILVPVFGVIAYFVLSDLAYTPFRFLGAFLIALLMLLQGLYYQHKVKKRAGGAKP